MNSNTHRNGSQAERNRETSCPGCNAPGMYSFYELKNVPVNVGRVVDSPEEARSVTLGDIELCYCHCCGLVHNVAFDPSRSVSNQATKWPFTTRQRFAISSRESQVGWSNGTTCTTKISSTSVVAPATSLKRCARWAVTAEQELIRRFPELGMLNVERDP